MLFDTQCGAARRNKVASTPCTFARRQMRPQQMCDPLNAKHLALIDARIATEVARALEAHDKQILDKQAYRPEEAARILGMSITTLRQAVWDGAIPHFRIGKVIRIPKPAIDALLSAGARQ
jgi:excisionase family DNA binding protein